MFFHHAHTQGELNTDGPIDHFPALIEDLPCCIIDNPGGGYGLFSRSSKRNASIGGNHSKKPKKPGTVTETKRMWTVQGASQNTSKEMDSPMCASPPLVFGTPKHRERCYGQTVS